MIDMVLVGSVKESTSAIQSMSMQLSSLGICGNDTADAIVKTVGYMELGAGVAQILLASKATYDAMTARKAAEGAALTAANVAAGPIGWGKITLAAGVTVAVTSVLIGLAYNLSTQEGRLNAVTSAAVA